VGEIARSRQTASVGWRRNSSMLTANTHTQ
jgi:hypothetical protein